MTDPRPKRYVHESVIVAGLDDLMARGLVKVWRRDGRAWHVRVVEEQGPFDAREMAAWVEGANATAGGCRWPNGDCAKDNVGRRPGQ